MQWTLGSLLIDSPSPPLPFISYFYQLKVLQTMSREEIDQFVESRIVSEDMHVYRSTDFEGFGRSLGYGTDKSINTKMQKAESEEEEAIKSE
jgi:hypothetical protein